jgi:hypothetical protein
MLHEEGQLLLRRWWARHTSNGGVADHMHRVPQRLAHTFWQLYLLLLCPLSNILQAHQHHVP